MRLESLTVDKNDEKLFRETSENKNFGISMPNRYHAHVPMFFNRFGSEIDLIGQYNGASVFFICNGPSFANLDHNKLKMPGIMTYGINNGPRTFRPNAGWSCVDDASRFLKSIWTDPCITKFVPMSFVEKKLFDSEKWQMTDIHVGDCPNVVYFRRNEKFHAPRFLFENTVCWGNHKNHGGGRSVMLAAIKVLFLLGFRKVYLLGCDLNMSETAKYHFEEERSKGAINCNMSTYRRLKEEYFPQLKPYFDQEGFEVYNCNPDSALRCFPFVSFDDAIKEATSRIGDISKERTYGMYAPPEEKHKLKANSAPVVTMMTDGGKAITVSTGNQMIQNVQQSSTMCKPMDMPVVTPIQTTDTVTIPLPENIQQPPTNPSADKGDAEFDDGIVRDDEIAND